MKLNHRLGHNGAVAINPALDPTDCPGLLELDAVHSEQSYQGPRRQLVTVRVEIFRCLVCGHIVSVYDGVTANHYPARPRDVVRELAESFELPRG